MTKILENDFNVLYQNDSTSNYLVLRTDIEKPAINYQVQMLLNNKLNGLLRFNVNYIDDCLNCFYDVTSKCTLAGFLSRKRFSRDEFLKAILNIINNIYQLKSYLLYDSNIILDENLIYVEPENVDIYFVYLPFSGYENNFKAFFAKLIFKLVKFQDEFSDNYIQRILEMIKDDNFNIAELKSLVENLIGEEVKNQALQMNSGAPKNEEESDIDKVKKHSFRSDKSEKGQNKAGKAKEDPVKEVMFRADKCGREKAVITRGNIKIPFTSNIDSEKKQKSSGKVKESKRERIHEGDDKFKKPKLFLMTILFFQLFFVITVILAVNSDFVKMSDNPVNTMVILIFIFLCIDVLAIRMVIENRKRICNSDGYMPLQKITDVMKGKTRLKSEESINTPINDKESQLPASDKFYNGETEIIKIPEAIDIPYLKEKDGEEIIKINKKGILIGRMGNFVDFVINNNAIGKIHAEILKEEGNLYVIDCNSRNGTFLNDSRIAPNTKNKLNDGDILRFANMEYIFYHKSMLKIT